MPEIKARTRLTFHQLVEGQSSYTHIRYSADGKTFTPASAAALEQAKNWPIEGRNIFILNGATLRYDTRGIVNQVHRLGRLSRVIRKHKDKRLIRVSANVTFRGCTFKSGNLCLLQMNGTTYGWNGTSVYSTGHGSNQTYRVSTVMGVSYGADHDDAGLNIRIDHISGGSVEVTNLQLEFVESVSNPGTPYKPSPEDAAIGTTPGRYRGEVVTDSPIAPIDFNAYTWVDTKGEKGDDATTIYLRGTGLNRNANGILRIGGVDIVNGGWSGLRMVTLRRDTLAKVSDWVAVYGNAADWEALKNRLNALDENVFVALMSCDATMLNQSHIDVLERFGADIPANFGVNLSTTSGVSYRRPFVFLGYKGLPKGRALWMLSGLEATAPFAEVSTYVAERTFISADKGDRGIPGEKGADGKTAYTHIAYADNAQGGGFSQQPGGKAYMGMYVDHTEMDSSDPNRYKWSLIKGQKGDQGVPGKNGSNGSNGADGRTPYFHTAYASSADGRTNFHLSDPAGRTYIGVYTDYTQADSTEPSKYTWSLIKGDKGDRGEKGDNGRSVTAVKTQYYLSTSKSVQQGGAWQDTPPSWQRGKYLWTRLHTSFSDGSSTTTAPVVDSGWEIQGQLQIGGTNLFGFRRGLQYRGQHTVIAPNPGINGISVKMSEPLASGVICRIQKLGFGRPGLYTVSGYIKATKAVRLQLDICDAGHTMVDVTTEFKPFQLTANVTMYWQADNYNGFFDIEAPSGNNLQPGNVIEVHNLMIERGNIASDYRQAEEDATYMQRILEENLRIENVSVGGENGVSFAGRFEARELKNDEYITRSFLNGDTAGTRPAFAAGVENFGMPTESYATALYHDGSGHIGQMSFTPDGQMYVGRGAIEESKVRFSGLPMPNLSTLNELLTATATLPRHTVTAQATNNPSSVGGAYSLQSDVLGAPEITLNAPIGELTIKGYFKVNMTQHPAVADELNPYMDAHLYVQHSDGRKVLLSAVRLFSRQSSSTLVSVNKTLTNLPMGTYRLHIHAQAFGASSMKAEFSMNEAGIFSGRLSKPMTSVHTDGVLSYNRPDQFVALQDGLLTVKGEMDIPGVLLAGRVKANGQPKVYWGSKARKIGTKTQRLQWVGTYRVYHTIGHENYAPIVTGIGDNQHIFGQLTTIAADYFDVCIKSVNGTFVNGEFSFSVFGMN